MARFSRHMLMCAFFDVQYRNRTTPSLKQGRGSVRRYSTDWFKLPVTSAGISEVAELQLQQTTTCYSHLAWCLCWCWRQNGSRPTGRARAASCWWRRQADTAPNRQSRTIGCAKSRRRQVGNPRTSPQTARAAIWAATWTSQTSRLARTLAPRVPTLLNTVHLQSGVSFSR